MEFPNLNTERLLLRKLQSSDFESLVEEINIKDISENILNIPFPYGKEDAEKRLDFIDNGFQQGERYVFVIISKLDSSLKGEIGIHLDKENDKAEIGYWIGKNSRGNGFASEALKEVIRFGFEKLKLNKIYATHFLANEASGMVLIKNGMIKEGELVEHYKHNGEYRSVAMYRLTRSEYDKRHSERH